MHETLLTAFAPQHVTDVVNDVLRRAGLPLTSHSSPSSIENEGPPATIEATPTTLSIGGVTVPKRRAARPELVPRAWPYYDTPQHTRLLGQLLQDWAAGEKAVLLVGNQVGGGFWGVWGGGWWLAAGGDRAPKRPMHLRPNRNRNRAWGRTSSWTASSSCSTPSGSTSSWCVLRPVSFSVVFWGGVAGRVVMAVVALDVGLVCWVTNPPHQSKFTHPPI